jgi:hypothetical protein
MVCGESEGFVEEEVVDHPVAAFVVELGSHVSDALEGHQLELVAQRPHFATVLPTVGCRRVPGPPILLRSQRQFLSDLAHPGDGARVGDCGVSVAGVDHDFVPVEGDQLLVDPVGASGAPFVCEVIVGVAHGVVDNAFRNAQSLAVVSIEKDLVDTVGIDAGRSPGEFIGGLPLDSEGQSSEFLHGESFSVGVGIVLVAGLEGIVNVETINEFIDLSLGNSTLSISSTQASGRSGPCPLQALSTLSYSS